MIKRLSRLPILFFLTAALLFCPASVWAAVSYDAYAPLTPQQIEDRAADTRHAEYYRYAGEIGALPFDLLKYAMDPALYLVESKHIPKKVMWIIEELSDRGIKPILLKGGKGAGLGLDLELVRLLGQKGRYPNIEFNNRIEWEAGDEFGVASVGSWRRINGTPLSLRGGLEYLNEHDEPFWGLGPDSMIARESPFSQESTELFAAVDYDVDYAIQASYEVRYQHVNIGRGDEKKLNDIKTFFPTLPGISGGDEMGYTVALENNRLDRPKRPTKGHIEKLSLGYHHGVRGTDVRYFKYTVDAAWFLRVLSERRVLAARFYGAHHSELNGDDVPFFNRARLGGSRNHVEEGAPLRSYKRNRFIDNSLVLLNLEYRYNVWEYRDYKLDTAIFWDEGQVFNKFSKWQFKDLEASYGCAFRFYILDRNLVTLEFAHGDEGTRIYARSGTLF